MHAILMGDLAYRVPLTAQRTRGAPETEISSIFDRQVRAFGLEIQHRLGRLRVGIVGLGGLGSLLVDHLARLGVRDWVLVDPDVVELTNLNRLAYATLADAQKARPKVNVARSTIRRANPQASVRTLQISVLDPRAQRALKTCDLLIAATDNHSSRMVLNRLERRVTDVSGEYAIPDLGRWCLQCAGIVDPQQAGWELAPAFQRTDLLQRGYVQDTPAAAVRHLDGVVASLAAAEIHNLVHAFKPQHRYLVYDALRTELAPLQVPTSHDCPVCSPDTGVLGLGDLEPLPDYLHASRVPPAGSGRVPAASSSQGTLADPAACVSQRCSNSAAKRRHVPARHSSIQKGCGARLPSGSSGKTLASTGCAGGAGSAVGLTGSRLTPRLAILTDRGLDFTARLRDARCQDRRTIAWNLKTMGKRASVGLPAAS